MQHTMTAATDTGSVRATNEDSVCIVPNLGIAALADGMGGHKAGEIASRMAVDTLVGHFEEWIPDPGSARAPDPGELMREALHAANREVCANGRRYPHMEGMGTTLTAVHVRDRSITIGHIGDSRCYRFRDRELVQLTEDHTLASQLLRTSPDGQVPAFSHHVLNKALGIEPPSEPDILDGEVLAGDVLLLCSDGLSGVVPDTEVAGILAHAAKEPENCVDALIGACLREGAPDNVSVILVSFH